MSGEIINDRRRFLSTAAMTFAAARLGVLGPLGKLMARRFEIEFLDPGVEAFAFTFG